MQFSAPLATIFVIQDNSLLHLLGTFESIFVGNHVAAVLSKVSNPPTAGARASNKTVTRSVLGDAPSLSPVFMRFQLLPTFSFRRRRSSLLVRSATERLRLSL